MIELHFCATPNGWKPAILLEELKIAYRVKSYNMLAGEHLTPEFHAININHKIPVIVDHAPKDGGAPITVFESGAILIYLAEKYEKFLPTEIRSRTLTLQWLTWQVAGLGPMFGQASHFIRYAPDGQDYAIARYVNEAKRLSNVLEERLAQAPYLAGDYSIADIAVWSWIGVFANAPSMIGIDRDAYPATRRWTTSIAERPAVRAVFANPETAIKAELVKPKMELTEEEWSNTFGANALAASSRAGVMS